MSLHLRVLGSYGGTSRDHRGVSFLIQGRVAVDAGSLASGLSLEEQSGIETILVTHSHLDHVGDLGAVCDVRSQQEGPPLVIAGLGVTIAALRQHFFNDVLWPDFTRIPSAERPTLTFHELEPEVVTVLSGLTVLPVLVNHSVPSCGFFVGAGDHVLAYTGDTGPTQRFWEVLNGLPPVRALITEVSFPDRMGRLAEATGHLTPASFAAQLDKVRVQPELGTFVYGMKPVFAEEIRGEMAPLIGKKTGNGVQFLAAGGEYEV
jgi:cAMP phosphodiesterase